MRSVLLELRNQHPEEVSGLFLATLCYRLFYDIPFSALQFLTLLILGSWGLRSANLISVWSHEPFTQTYDTYAFVISVYLVDIIENPQERPYLALVSKDWDGGADAPIVRTVLLVLPVTTYQSTCSTYRRSTCDILRWQPVTMNRCVTPPPPNHGAASPPSSLRRR